MRLTSFASLAVWLEAVETTPSPTYSLKNYAIIVASIVLLETLQPLLNAELWLRLLSCLLSGCLLAT